MNKKGASLVELIAVIVIMGIVASISTVTVVTLINRQKKNVTVNSLNSIYKTAKDTLNQSKTGSDDGEIVVVDDSFCYTSLTTLIDKGIIEGDNFKPQNNEIYFCHGVDNFWVEITNSTPSQTEPSSTGTAIVNGIEVTYNYSSGKFKGV